MRHLAAAGVLCGVIATAGRAQWGPPDPSPARVARTAAPISLDGVFDEPAWFTTDSIADFTQTEPDEGQPATERTVVRFLARADGLYVGVWASDSIPGAIRHAQLRRDSDFGSDDSFTLMLDPQRDHRTGYLFAVNPNGAMADAEVINFETTNADWNGVWDARARVTAFGWTAEIFIPWQTLRSRPDGDVWGVNCQRLIRRKNEAVLWQAWRRTEGILFLLHEGTVAGFSGLPQRAIGEFRPYMAVNGELRELRYPPEGTDSVLVLGDRGLKVGVDAKVALAPTLTLDLTGNTDFAQVEADNQVINLTRFPLFFPEKRPFFLESSGIFSFGQADRTTVFYSRRIGLDTPGHPILLAAGARLTGRLGRDQIGFLAVRTGDSERALDLVARVKHDVFARGYVGAILTGQSGAGASGKRLAGGVDLYFPFIVHGQNLVFGAYGAGSRDRAAAPVASAWRVFVDFPNDFMDNFAPPAAFEIFPGNTIAPGNYYSNRAEIEVASSAGRAVGLKVTASAGDFYTGTATELDAALTVRTAPHVITEVEAIQEAARLATGRFTARTARLRLDVAATPRLGNTLFLQWDNESDRLTVNARVHWIPNPGSDAYLVWNSAWPTGLAQRIPWARPARGAVVGKLVYYFRL